MVEVEKKSAELGRKYNGRSRESGVRSQMEYSRPKVIVVCTRAVAVRESREKPGS